MSEAEAKTEEIANEAVAENVEGKEVEKGSNVETGPAENLRDVSSFKWERE